MSRCRAIAAVAAVLSAASVRAQTQWQLTGSAAAARTSGAAVQDFAGPRAAASDLPAGDYTVHFAVDALGKPASLAFAVPEQARVQLAVAPAAAAAAREVPLDGEGWTVAAGEPAMRTTGSLDEGDYRVEATFAATATTVAGLVARWRSATQYYACWFDAPRGELRLERRLGGDAFVLMRTPVAASAAAVRRLAVQLQGFRLQVWLDDVVVLQLFDGALTKGAFGVCWHGEAPVWQRFAVAEPAPRRASVALVQAGVQATLHAATNVTPGHWHALELALDRPHPLLPFDTTGCEPWLLQPPAAPRVVVSGLGRFDFAAGSFGEVGADGNVACRVELPTLPLLRGHVALARLLLITADGDECTAATPAVALHF